jgi:hypothetical protein
LESNRLPLRVQPPLSRAYAATAAATAMAGLYAWRRAVVWLLPESRKIQEVHLVYFLAKAVKKSVDVICYLIELAAQEERFTDFHPVQNTATRGGSLPGI